MEILTKIIWLMVRLFGVLLTLNALRLFSALIVSSIIVGSQSLDTESRIFGTTNTLLFWLVFEALICFGAGLYLIVDGRFLFNILDSDFSVEDKPIVEKYVDLERE